jgi:fructosamine-3-kinase
MIPNKIEEQIKNVVSSDIGKNVSVLDVRHVSGGCINNCFEIITSSGRFFLKRNNNAPLEMFESESKGLNLLRKSGSLYVPKVISCEKNYLLMEFVDEGEKNNRFWEKFGRGLSEMHQKTNSFYGLDHDNFIGSLAQKNDFKNSWDDFFINQRILPQLGFGDFSADFLLSFDKLFVKLDSIFPKEPPSLLHGDLWSGNFLVNQSCPTLIDPAVYFGFREMDIAMSKLFGGFDGYFYSSYNEQNPLSDGWEDRLDLCNLYPLLVHVNLFGEGYYNQVKRILSRFV